MDFLHFVDLEQICNLISNNLPEPDVYEVILRLNVLVNILSIFASFGTVIVYRSLCKLNVSAQSAFDFREMLFDMLYPEF